MVSAISLIVAIIALLLSAYSIYYTQKFNQYRVRIVHGCIDHQNPYLISFEVFNDSPRSLTITDISIVHPDGSPVQLMLDYEVEPNPLEITAYQEPFSGEELIAANSSSFFSYFVPENLKEIMVTVTADQPIHFGSNKKSVVLHLVKVD